MPGRFSSSHAFSSGRSISRTKSSRERAFCVSAVCASVLKAESTAALVDTRQKLGLRVAAVWQRLGSIRFLRRSPCRARSAALARPWSPSTREYPRLDRPIRSSMRLGRNRPAPGIEVPAAPAAGAAGLGAGASRLWGFRHTLTGIVIRNNAPNGGKDLLHRWFLRFCRLRHTRIPAACILAR